MKQRAPMGWRNMWLAALLAAALIAGGGCSDDPKPATTPQQDVGADADSDSGDARDVADEHDVSDVAEPDADVGGDAVDDVQEDVPPVFPGWPAAAALTVTDRRAMIEARVGEREPALFLFDTLSQTIFADIDLVGDDLFHREVVAVGGVELGEVIVKGRSMRPDEEQLGVDLGGLLGQAFFTDRFVVIDYGQARGYLSAVAPGPDDGAPPGHEGEARHAALYELPNLFPVITVQAGETTPVQVLADTSSRFNVITRTTFDALDDGTLPRVEGFRFLSNFGEDAGFMTRLPELRVGDVVVRDLECAVIPDDNHLKPVLEPNRVFVEGFLGAPFWARFVVGIGGFRVAPGESEGGTREFVLWGDGERPVEDHWTRVPVEVTLVDGLTTVEMSYRLDGGAEPALAVGDVIERIDDQPVGALADTRARLQGEVGQQRTLHIVRGGEAMDVTVAVEALLP